MIGVEAKVLIVDDDPDILALLSRLLKVHGYRTATALSGEEALSTARRERPQVVLLDYMMPGLSGLEVLKRLKEATPEIQVLIITGRGDENTATKLMRSGALDYIPKPFENRRILEAVRTAVEGHRREVDRRAAEEEKDISERRLRSEHKSLEESVVRAAHELEIRGLKLQEANLRLQETNRALERKNHELARLEGLYQELFDRAGAGILKTDLAGRILMANRMAASLLGAEFRLGAHLQELLDQPSRAAFTELLGSLAGGRVALEELEVRLAGPDGPRTVELRAVPLRHGADIVQIEFLMNDASGRIHQEEIMSKLRERAVVAGLSRHLSHVLLNSLTGGAGQLRKARQALEPGSDAMRHLDVIAAEMVRMEDVVRGYQDYVNIMALIPSSLVRLADFAVRYLERIRGGREDRDSARVLRAVRGCFLLVPGDIRPTDAAVMVDQPLMELGLAHLLRGIVRLSPSPSPDHPTEVVLSTCAGDGAACLDFMAPGIPYSREKLSGLYTPWDHQMLGQIFEDWAMSVADGMAERHGGRLTVEAREGGTLFSLRLPPAAP